MWYGAHSIVAACAFAMDIHWQLLQIVENEAEAEKQQQQQQTCDAVSGLHVCPGSHCKHVRLDSRQATYVCELSGVCYEQHHCSDPVYRSTTNTVVQVDGYQPARKRARRDPLKASVAAYRRATENLKAAFTPSWTSENARTLHRAHKPTANTSRTSEMHHADRIIDKLVPATAAQVAAIEQPAASHTCGDDADALTTVYTKRYLKSCACINARPSVHALHDLHMQQQTHIAPRCRCPSTVPPESDWWMQTRTALARLCVTLWHALQKTPYMQKHKRAGDSFQQFVVGVAYSTRRGIQMANAQILIPCCPALADRLPLLRTPDQKHDCTTRFRVSPHKGASILHKALASLSSVPVNCQENMLADAQKASVALQKLQARNAQMRV